MTTRLIRFTPRETPVDDSGREPDGVTHQVRFCEGGGTYPKGDSRYYSPLRPGKAAYSSGCKSHPGNC